MIQIDLFASEMTAKELGCWIKSSLEELPPDSVVKLKVHGKISAEAMNVLSAPSLRSLAPPTMNVNTTFTDYIANRYKRNR